MRMKSVFGVFAIALCLPAAAFAQDRKLFGEVGIGPTFLFGETADLVNTGFNFDLGATYMVTPMFGVKIDTLISWHDVKDSVTASFATICDPWLFICYPSLVPVDQIVGERSSWDVGMNVGGGVNFRFGDSKAFFANAKFLPLVFGVRF